MPTSVHLGSYEGRQAEVRQLKPPPPPIEVFRNIYKDRPYRVNLEISEFSAICPKTSLPDYGVLYIAYYPRDYCIELKSLKEYILFYRNIGIFQENAANRIRDDFIQACKPLSLRLHLDYNVRGGIKTRVSLIYKKGHKKLEKSQAN